MRSWPGGRYPVCGARIAARASGQGTRVSTPLSLDLEPMRVAHGAWWAGRACCFFKYFFDKYLR